MKWSILQSLRAPAGALALATAALGMLPGGTVPAAEPGAVVPVLATSPNTLQSISVQTVNGAQVQLTLHMSAPAPMPLGFAIDKPARISFDLPNTTLALPSRRIDVGAGGVDTILAAEADGRSRLVLDLDQPMPYQTRVNGDDIVVTVGAGGGTHGAAGAAPADASVATASAAATAEPREIKSIDFRRSATGAAQLVVQAVRSAHTDRPEAARLADRGELLRHRAAATAHAALRHAGFRHAGHRLRGRAGRRQCPYRPGRAAATSTSSPTRPTISTWSRSRRCISRSRSGTAEVKKSYNGERLTLNFQDISTRAVLQLLADASGQNIVVSDSVNGSVTLRLQNVPWDQALDIVLPPRAWASARTATSSSSRPPMSWRRARRRISPPSRTSSSSSRCAPSICRSTTPRRPTSPRC